MTDKKFNDEECALDPGTQSLADKESFNGSGFNDVEDAAPIDGKQTVADGNKQASGFNDDAALGIDDGNKIGS